jgi:Uma2 family endonuclease
MDPATKRATVEDLLALDLGEGPLPELVDGEIVSKALPRAAHGYVHTRITRGIGDAEDGEDGGWWILIEPDVVFADDRLLRPDLAGWRKSRLPVLDDAPIGLAPDWVCEILSPTHAAHDRVTKRAIYADEGVPWLWLASPEDRTLEVFALRDGSWLLLGTWTSGERRIPPFEQLVIDVERLFVPRRGGEPPVAKEPVARYGLPVGDPAG